MYVFGDAGTFAAQQDSIVGSERERVQSDVPGGRHQDQTRFRGAIGEEAGPRRMAPDDEMGGVIESSALQSPVVEQETAWLDQIDFHPKTGRQPQQATGILRNVRLE